MKKLFTLLCFVFLVLSATAKQVPQQDAQSYAKKFYRLNNPSGITNPQIKSSTVRSSDNVPTVYIFRFVSGGFVIMAADDACTPVLGYSFDNEMPETIDHPAVNDWLDRYSREVACIVGRNLDNSVTLAEWRSTQKVMPRSPVGDVLPLLTTIWDQNCNYNTQCPAEADGACGHAYTGCVATAMSQIMKYHNFPPKGVGQHAYQDGNYGQQSADFGNTTYDWASMPITADSNSSSLQTIMHHAGVSMDMGYGAQASGAQSDYVFNAFSEYFNYSPEIESKYKDSYANAEDFRALLMADLNAGLPIHYAGYGPYGGHDFVCDGYRMSDGKFHFNWGWSGAANGYFTIGNLNPDGYPFNTGDIVTLHIKPYNPNLIVRITSPANKTVTGAGSTVNIKAKVVRGMANQVKIIIDSVEKASASGDSISYAWNTTTADPGSHVVQAIAINATDTVYYKILVNVVNEDQWISQSSGFPGSRVISYISAVDSNVIWAAASNAGNPLWGTSSDFTRTTNGGITWKPGIITNTAGLIPAMIFGRDSLNAYAAMYRLTGNTSQGVYKTSDGGTTWARQVTASFSSSSSLPNIVHFFNASDGVCVGNPFSGEYEIYTTTNGGINWTKAPGANIPNPLAAETGVGGCYAAIHDTIWFGTILGRVYRSVDKGIHWTVSAPVAMNGKYVKPVFRDGSHGLLLDELSGIGLLCETSDGGVTWTKVNYSGPNYSGDLAWVPGTSSTWVRSGYLTGPQGCAYSFDGGSTWTDFPGTSGSPFSRMAWINSHCGWSGGINTSPTANGVHKFKGSLLQLPAPQNLNGVVTNDRVVNLSWLSPVYSPAQMMLQGYNVKRNGTRINNSLITGTAFTDYVSGAGGHYSYCVWAQYNIGASNDSCITVDVAVGVQSPVEQHSMVISPNPAHGSIRVITEDQVGEIGIFDLMGNAVPAFVTTMSVGISTIDISGLSPGIYIVSARTDHGTVQRKFVKF
jgi:photosystem II stability/assembly factor-like uncharacterized protein